MDLKFLRQLRILALIEGVSTLLLFGVAMPLKYAAGMPMAVTIVGSLHGILFVGVVGMFLTAITRVPISAKLAMAGIFGAIVPFGPFVVDSWLKKLDTSQ
ncbi:MAG: DUF3817 domain-containing protein [Planctomycetota bacterium]